MYGIKAKLWLSLALPIAHMSSLVEVQEAAAPKEKSEIWRHYTEPATGDFPQLLPPLYFGVCLIWFKRKKLF